MKLEDYTKLVETVTAENAVDVLNTVMAGLKQDLTERDTLAEKVADLDKKNRDLQDTNIKLFLSQTTKATHTQEDDDDATGVEALDNFATTMREKYKEA